MNLPAKAVSFIPQRKPVVLVDQILHCNDNAITTDFLITDTCLFVENRQLSAAGIMENIAQTAAARIGVINQDKAAKIGVIGAIDKFELFENPSCGTTIQTIVTEEFNIFPALMVSAEVFAAGRLIASCRMKVFVTDTDNE